MRVLICDDEPDIRLLFRTAFEREGAVVDEASDGDECLRVASANCPDVVILDLMMPKRDGLSTLPMLRRQCPSSAVVVVTAHAAIDAFEVSRARGASACFDKLGFLPRVPWVVSKFNVANGTVAPA
ncbi:MAG: two-component system, NtrC family, nitrogen regulation response regulator NtrX [Acidimicrobiaceae bacterium]|jgi:CheY-like chemotaxis protein